MHKTSKQAYMQRIHVVQDYIETHLYEELPLELLADIAGFSKYHFHRIFKAVTNESLLQFIQRIKMERVASFLLSRTDVNITDIAYHFGYADSAIFSRTFKQHYAISPSAYRKKYSKNCKVQKQEDCYTVDMVQKTTNRAVEELHVSVSIQTCESFNVAYVRYTGTYTHLAEEFPQMQVQLFSYASKQQLLIPGKTKVLSIYHDNHSYTNERQLRTSFGLSVPSGTCIDITSGIGLMEIIGGTYAVGHFELDATAYGKAWEYMYGEWLLGSGYKPRDSFPFEVYGTEANMYPPCKQVVDIYVPIEQL